MDSEELERRIKIILPDEYQDSYESVRPVSMGSAALTYRPDGRVAWGDMWQTFCDLAMAGGPPHRGRLLEAGTVGDRAVADEICRGIRLVADVAVMPLPNQPWVRIDCEDEGMAQWLVRAITMENISARCDGCALDLPAGAGFRVEKEIKNVITGVAKTCHYYLDHTPYRRRCEIRHLFEAVARESPFVQPEYATDGADIADSLQRATGLTPVFDPSYKGWLGLQCPDVKAAVWIMRALVVCNVLARREGTVLFVPANAATDPGGSITARMTARIHNLAKVRGVL